MSTLCALVPAKSFRDSKRRLASALDEDDRARLSANMLARTLRVLREAIGNQRITVVTTDDQVAQFALSNGADDNHCALAAGLNLELQSAAATVPEDAALLTIHGDLPRLDADDVRALLSASAQLAIAPDHIATGTNALLQRQSDRFFAFGPESFARHVRMASERHLTIATISRPGLAEDLDSPVDLARLETSNLCKRTLNR